MSDPDLRFDRQGAEPPLTIDRQRRPRARGPAPVTLIVSVMLLAVVLGGVLYMYRAGSRGAGDAPTPLGAPLGDVRAPPPAQTQSPDASAGLTISKDEPGAPAGSAQTLAPPPEAPLPQAPTPAPAQAPVPAGTAPPAPAAPADAAPQPARRSPAAGADRPDAIDRLIAKSDAKTSDAKRSEGGRSDAGSDSPDGEPPVMVQIGAFSSQSLADAEWNKAAAVAPGAMAGKGKRVVPVSRDGATLYRTSITGFASREQAQALCARLKAAGGVCFVH